MNILRHLRSHPYFNTGILTEQVWLQNTCRHSLILRRLGNRQAGAESKPTHLEPTGCGKMGQKGEARDLLYQTNCPTISCTVARPTIMQSSLLFIDNRKRTRYKLLVNAEEMRRIL